jgi:hypothetical protein
MRLARRRVARISQHSPLPRILAVGSLHSTLSPGAYPARRPRVRSGRPIPPPGFDWHPQGRVPVSVWPQDSAQAAPQVGLAMLRSPGAAEGPASRGLFAPRSGAASRRRAALAELFSHVMAHTRDRKHDQQNGWLLVETRGLLRRSLLCALSLPSRASSGDTGLHAAGSVGCLPERWAGSSVPRRPLWQGGPSPVSPAFLATSTTSAMPARSAFGSCDQGSTTTTARSGHFRGENGKRNTKRKPRLL